MIIDGFQKLTLLDYPGYLACIIFTRGCNWNCPYCQNSSLIKYENDKGLFSEQEILNYLKKRQGILEGIVISGGEPTIQVGLESFLEKIRALGFKIKLDTNGSNPQVINNLIKKGLVDYIAMDIKCDFNQYYKIINTKLNEEKVKESIQILRNSNIKYEFRTTVIKGIHTSDILQNIVNLIDDSPYYIQNFKQSDDVRDNQLSGFSDNELLNMVQKLSRKVNLRGIIDNNINNKEEVNYYV